MATATTTNHPKTDASVVIVVVLAFLGVFAIAAGITFAGGGSIAGALGVGLFCAIWGGPGFGVMVAGARYTSRWERDTR